MFNYINNSMESIMVGNQIGCHVLDVLFKRMKKMEFFVVLEESDDIKKIIYDHLNLINHKDRLHIHDYSKISVLIAINRFVEKANPHDMRFLPIRVPNCKTMELDKNLFSNSLFKIMKEMDISGMSNNMSKFLGCTPNCVSSGGFHMHRERYLTTDQLLKLSYYRNNGMVFINQIWHTITDVGVKNKYIDVLFVQENRQNFSAYQFLPVLSLVELCLVKIAKNRDLKMELIKYAHINYRFSLCAVSGIVLFGDNSDFINMNIPVKAVGVSYMSGNYFALIMAHFGSVPMRTIDLFPFNTYCIKTQMEGWAMTNPYSVSVYTGERMNYDPKQISSHFSLPHDITIMDWKTIYAYGHNQCVVMSFNYRNHLDKKRGPLHLSERLGMMTLIDKGLKDFDIGIALNYCDQKAVIIMNSIRGIKRRAYFGCLLTSFKMSISDNGSSNIPEIATKEKVVHYWDGEKMKIVKYQKISDFLVDFGVEIFAWSENFILFRPFARYVDVRGCVALFQFELVARTATNCKYVNNSGPFVYMAKKMLELLKTRPNNLLKNILVRNINYVSGNIFKSEAETIHFVYQVEGNISDIFQEITWQTKINKEFETELNRLLGEFDDEEITQLSGIKLDHFSSDIVHYNGIWDGESMLNMNASCDCDDNSDARMGIIRDCDNLEKYYHVIGWAALDQRYDEEEAFCPSSLPDLSRRYTTDSDVDSFIDDDSYQDYDHDFFANDPEDPIDTYDYL